MDETFSVTKYGKSSLINISDATKMTNIISS
jgi:hypothetical protein